MNLKRKSQNLYPSLSGFYIITKYCYEYTYGDHTILKYEKYSYDNNKKNSSGTECQVNQISKISSSNASLSLAMNSKFQSDIEVAHNDELFVIHGEKYKAKTYCLG